MLQQKILKLKNIGINQSVDSDTRKPLFDYKIKK